MLKQRSRRDGPMNCNALCDERIPVNLNVFSLTCSLTVCERLTLAAVHALRACAFARTQNSLDRGPYCV